MNSTDNGINSKFHNKKDKKLTINILNDPINPLLILFSQNINGIIGFMSQRMLLTPAL